MNDDNRPTLEAWIMSTGVNVYVHYHHTGAVGVYADEKTPRFKQLWDLRDFLVSSISGPVVWMVPKMRG